MHAHGLSDRDVEPRMAPAGLRCLLADAFHEDASMEEVGDDQEPVGAQTRAPLDAHGDARLGEAREGALHGGESIPLPQ